MPGRPAPQGSKRHVGRGRLIESSKYVKPWRQVVDAAARLERAKLDGPLDGPLELTVIFYLARGKTVRRLLPTVAPDLSKLARSTEDALTTAGLIVDDSRITALHAWKRYAGERGPGALIRITPDTEEDLP